jgi:hypothetical protein
MECIGEQGVCVNEEGYRAQMLYKTFGQERRGLLSRDAELFERFQRADVVARSNATLGGVA